MNFLDMQALTKGPIPLYEWYRGVSGSWHHWEKAVLNGEIILHVEGAEDMGYWGIIKTSTDVSLFYSTRPDDKGLHVPFKTPENCVLHLESRWKEIINQEVNRNKI